MGERIELSARGVVLVDELGALAIRTQPEQELALVLDVGGRLNKTDERDKRRRYLLAPGQAAELIAIVVAAGQQFPDFARELQDALEREQARLAAIEAEHREETPDG